ncbi:MAG: hypothetical protein MZV65_01230 [Chromatiales bacterium]|nr:hypothetical protein [Chromatiales bacterium]
MLHEGSASTTSRASRRSAHPMAILSAMINAGELLPPGRDQDARVRNASSNAARLLSQGAHDRRGFAYKTSVGQPLIYPKPRPRLLRELPAHDVLDPVSRTTSSNPEVVQGAAT